MQNTGREEHTKIALSIFILKTHTQAVLLKYWICQNAWQTNNLHYNAAYPWYCCSFVCDIVKFELAMLPLNPHTQVITLSRCSQFSVCYRHPYTWRHKYTQRRS